MTQDECIATAAAMLAYGGGFVQALAGCFHRADSVNLERLIAAFPDYVKQYGPGSAFYKAALKS